MTKICCVCKRVEQGLHWQEGLVFPENEQTSHGYCPRCFDVVMAELMKIKDREQVTGNRSRKKAGLLER